MTKVLRGLSVDHLLDDWDHREDMAEAICGRHVGIPMTAPQTGELCENCRQQASEAQIPDVYE